MACFICKAVVFGEYHLRRIAGPAGDNYTEAFPCTDRKTCTSDLRSAGIGTSLGTAGGDGRRQGLCGTGTVGHVSWARISQNMNLLLLVPDIHVEILFLPKTTSGYAQIKQQHLQPICLEIDWAKENLERLCLGVCVRS